MPKVIASPSKRWPGSVTLYDPLTLPQVEAIETALAENRGREETSIPAKFDRSYIPAFIACVEVWNIQDFPNPPALETWPLSPRRDASVISSWLLTEILRIYNGEMDIPNE